LPFVVDNRLAPRWLHAWAVLTACATVVLLAVGSVVTTRRVGMADPVWPTYPWHLLLIDWQEPSPGFLIEHTHRLVGYLVGCCVIVLAWGLWQKAGPRWLKWLGIVALLGVILQGLLGGFRVRLNALVGPNLAVIHGCFAQVVFSLLVGLALMTSRRFASVGLPVAGAPRLRKLSLLLVGVVLLQLVWGAVLRHRHTALSQRMHLLTAFAVVAVAAWLGRALRESAGSRRVLGGAWGVLAILLTLQVMLGIEAWLEKYGSGILPELQMVTGRQVLVVMGHVLVGAGILATATALALLAWRPVVGAALVPAEGRPGVASEGTYRAAEGLGGITPGAARQLEGTA
jgi:cytochrome c oxidase assembly protein subunit 15